MAAKQERLHRSRKSMRDQGHDASKDFRKEKGDTTLRLLRGRAGLLSSLPVEPS